MSEEETRGMSLPQLREKMEQIGRGVVLGLEWSRRTTSAERVSLVLAAAAAGVVAVQLFIYFQTGAWQTLVVAGSMMVALVFMLIAYGRIHREELDAAGYCIYLGLLVAYGGGELALSGLTLYFAVSGILLIVIVGRVLLPHKWGIWLAIVGLYGVIIFLINWLEPLPRYNAARFTMLSVQVACVTVLLGLIVIWQFFRVYQGAGTIRNRLLVSFMLVGLLPIAVVGVMLVVVGSRYGRQQAVEQLEVMAKVKEAEIDKWVDNLHVDLEAVLAAEQAAPRAALLVQTPDWLSSLEFWMRDHLQQMVGLMKRIDELFLINLQGQVVLSTDATQEGEDRGDEAYFQEGVKGAYLQSFTDSRGQMSVIVVRPVVSRDGEGVGVLAGRVNTTTLSEILGEGAWMGDTGEIYLADQSRIPLTPLRFGEGRETPLDTEGVKAAIETHEDGYGLYDDYRGESVVGVYHWLPKLEVALLAKQDQTEALRVTNSMLRLIGYVAVGTLAISAITSLLITRRIADPLADLTETAAHIAAGELEHVVHVEQEDEIGTLAQAFNSMTSRLRDMLHDEQSQREYLQTTVQEYVDYMAQVGQGDLAGRLSLDNDGRGDEDPLIVLGHQLNETTASLQDMIDQIHKAANDLNSAAADILAATTQQVSGASEQSAAISQTTTTVDELKAIAEQSVSRAQEVAGTSQRTVEISRAGREAVEDTVESMREIKVQVEGIAGNILVLAERMQQIGEIIATVNEIAAQSNMLALNARVEAARAGEYGKGFAVVAQEVRSLAEQSKRATAQVRAILSDVHQATNATVMVTEEGTKVVGEGLKLAGQTGAVIERLANVIDEAAQAAMQMRASGRQQVSGVEQISVAMQNINQATTQSLDSTRQAEKAAQELNDLACSLMEIVGQYRF